MVSPPTGFMVKKEAGRHTTQIDLGAEARGLKFTGRRPRKASREPRVREVSISRT